MILQAKCHKSALAIWFSHRQTLTSNLKRGLLYSLDIVTARYRRYPVCHESPSLLPFGLVASPTAIRPHIGTRTIATHSPHLLPFIIIIYYYFILSCSQTWHFVPVWGATGRLATRITYARLGAHLPCPQVLNECLPVPCHQHSTTYGRIASSPKQSRVLYSV